MSSQNNKLDNLIKQSGGKIDRKVLENAQKSGDVSALVDNLSTEDKQKLNNLLNDKEQLSKVLKSPQAQMLLKLFGGGKNG